MQVKDSLDSEKILWTGFWQIWKGYFGETCGYKAGGYNLYGESRTMEDRIDFVSWDKGLFVC